MSSVGCAGEFLGTSASSSNTAEESIRYTTCIDRDTMRLRYSAANTLLFHAKSCSAGCRLWLNNGAVLRRSRPSPQPWATNMGLALQSLAREKICNQHCSSTLRVAVQSSRCAPFLVVRCAIKSHMYGVANGMEGGR